MRVSLAKIRLYLKTSKKLADGSHPIMLMCSFNGRKEVSTSCSCIPKYWDKKGECVKKGYPNWLVINSMIKKMKDDAIAIRDEYERLGEVYTPSMILSPKKVLSAVRSDLKALISEYIDEKGVDVSTAQKWWVVYRSVIKFNGGREVIVNEVDESFCRRYGRYLKDDCGLAVGTVRSYLTKLSAIFHYCVMKGILSISPIEKLIDLNCRYYSYRHSYLMSEIQKPNVNLLKIATECGKSVRTLHQYITLLNDEDLI